MFVIAEDFFRVFEEAQVPFGEHPVRNPAGDDDGLFVFLGAGQGGGHGWAGAWHQFDVSQGVFLDRFFGAAHYAGASVDAGDFAVEVFGVGLQVGDGFGLDVVGHDQADFGAGVVGAEHFNLVFEFFKVFAVGGGQPGGEGGVEVASRYALPHDGGLYGFECHGIAEFALQDFPGDKGGGDAVVPTVDVADVQGGFVRRHGAAHAEGQGGDAEALQAEVFQVSHRVCSVSESGSSVSYWRVLLAGLAG